MVKEEEATGAEAKTAEATTQAISHVLQGGVNPESGARVEIHGMSRVDATAAGRRAGGAQMTTWTVTAASWWVGEDVGIRVDMRAWMQLFRSSL